MPLPCAVMVRVKPEAVIRGDVVVMDEFRTVSVTDARLTVMVPAKLVVVLVRVEGPLAVVVVPKDAMVTPPSTLRVSADGLRVT